MKIGTKVICTLKGMLNGYVGYLSRIGYNTVYPYVIVQDKKDVGKSYIELKRQYGLWSGYFNIFSLEQITEIKK